jgi:hypothetical protein
MKELTAVEWLEEMLTISLGEHHMSLFINEFNKAKKIEKEHITDAWDSAYTAEGFFNAEHYYNETFKKEE